MLTTSDELPRSLFLSSLRLPFVSLPLSPSLVLLCIPLPFNLCVRLSLFVFLMRSSLLSTLYVCHTFLCNAQCVPHILSLHSPFPFLQFLIPSFSFSPFPYYASLPLFPTCTRVSLSLVPVSIFCCLVLLCVSQFHFRASPAFLTVALTLIFLPACARLKLCASFLLLPVYFSLFIASRAFFSLHPSCDCVCVFLLTFFLHCTTFSYVFMFGRARVSGYLSRSCFPMALSLFLPLPFLPVCLCLNLYQS